MRSTKAAIAVAALAASLATPAFAVGAPYIPPGNSAVNQYTETIPSAGGAVVAEGISGGNSKGSPEKNLGHHTTKVLKQHGAEGEAVAALASEGAAAPASEPETESSEATEASESSGGKKSSGGSKSKGGEGKSEKGGAAGGAGNGGSGNGGAGGTGSTSGGGGGGESATPQNVPVSANGSSALGQVVSHATLSSGGSAGIFLPLALLAALVWAVVFVVRRRRGEVTHA
jgi:hypothetical protein